MSPSYLNFLALPYVHSLAACSCSENRASMPCLSPAYVLVQSQRLFQSKFRTGNHMSVAENSSVVNTTFISSFHYTHVITSAKFRLK